MVLLWFAKQSFNIFLYFYHNFYIRLHFYLYFGCTFLVVLYMDEKAQSTKANQWLHIAIVYYMYLHVLVFVFCVLLNYSPAALNSLRRVIYFSLS